MKQPFNSCHSPFTVRDENDMGIAVPCGKCVPCLKRRVSGWSFRLMTERNHSLSAHFITLTYDTAHVPLTKNGFMSLDKTHLQKFFKRLRKASPRSVAIKYYAVGEYGGRSNRPHYHIILFNAKVELIQQAWSTDGKHIGSVHYGNDEGVTEKSVGYTLKYVTKPKRIPQHANDDRLPEFSLMSKDLGLHISIKKWLHGIMQIPLTECILISKGAKKLPCLVILKARSTIRRLNQKSLVGGKEKWKGVPHYNHTQQRNKENAYTMR